eukprot:304667_1
MRTCAHDDEYLAFKCKFCCRIAHQPYSHSSRGKVHLCDECGAPGVWDTLTTYSTWNNKKHIEEYEQCDALKQQIQQTMHTEEWNQWNRQQKDCELNKFRSDPQNCPLGIEHPPNGFDFALGCTLCMGDEDTPNIEEIKTKRKQRLKETMQFMNDISSGTVFSRDLRPSSTEGGGGRVEGGPKGLEGGTTLMVKSDDYMIYGRYDRVYVFCLLL